MKTVRGFFLFVFLLSFFFSSGQKGNNSVLDRKITLELRNTPVASILDVISSVAHVYFSYDASLFDAERKATLIVSDKTVLEALDLLFNNSFIYKELGDQIIITKPVNTTPQKKDTDSTAVKPALIVFSGKVIDREENKPLPYASISVEYSSIGTISNSDGEFELKIPETMRADTVVLSMLGYRTYFQPIAEINQEENTIYMQPVSIRLKEIKVTYISPDEIINKILAKISYNYPRKPEDMTAFYREVLKQDNTYTDVAEAVLEIRKASYDNTYSNDKIKLVKGRKNLNIKTFKYVDFKIQGGPFYSTKLDVVKTLDSFLDPDFREFYKYTLEQIIELDDRDTYVVRFRPKDKVDYPCYRGTMYVDMSTFALVRAEFSLSRSGLKFARESLIKKKPKNLYVRPIEANYAVSYRRIDNKWHFSTAHTSVIFKVRSKKDKVNSSFRSISDLLITDIKPDDGTLFKRNELFNPKDIFTDLITSYDENFWKDYNTIVPSENLRKALHDYYLKTDTLFHINNNEPQNQK